MTTQTKTIVWRQEGATRTDEEVRAEGEQLSCSLGTRVKEPPGGAFQSPAAGIRLAIYPPQRIRQRNVEKGPWRGSRHDNLPSSPSMVFRKVWRTEGVSTFSLGVLIRGHGIHIILDFFVVLGESGQRPRNHAPSTLDSSYWYSSDCFFKGVFSRSCCSHNIRTR